MCTKRSHIAFCVLVLPRYDVEIPTATALRKAVSTKAAKDLSDEQVRLLSRQMSHRVNTHRRHYEQLDTVAGATKAH